MQLQIRVRKKRGRKQMPEIIRGDGIPGLKEQG